MKARNPQQTITRALFTIVGGSVVLNPAFAQDATPPGQELEEVVVTGLRGSLKASMNTKREAIGVVEAINAEDIGKFPDTNLSEALQRITGVSIDRRNGEGALVTARGFGPQFNMVTLNGRQMPAADAFGSGELVTGGVGGNARSFNFANLAADSISAVEVYKTGKANVATGGIGATVNVRTARPFDNEGFVLNLGVKGVNDTTNRVGSDYTPELSGIFSYANDNKSFGVGLAASFSERDSGSSTATVNDWHIQPWSRASLDANRGSAPLFRNNNDTPDNANDDFTQAEIRGEPADGQLYGIPNDIRYAFSDSHRERVNGQLTLQFAPLAGLTFTGDLTYAGNEITEDRGEQTIWLQRNGFYFLEFDTDEEVATPVLLREYTGANKDFGYEQQHREQKNELVSVGFNAKWAVSDAFTLSADWHGSEARSRPNDPITGGSQTAFSLAGRVPSTGSCARPNVCNNFWTQEFRFSDGLPIAGRTFYPTNYDAYAGTNGDSNFSFDASNMASQILRIFYQAQDADIRQGRLDGELEFDNGRFQFGIETRQMQSRQRTSASNMTLGDWGGGDTGAVQDMVALLEPFSITGDFDDFNAAGAPTAAWRGNANVLGAWAIADPRYGNWTESSAPDEVLRYNPGLAVDSTVSESTNAVYAQIAWQPTLGEMPANLVVGLRYENTRVNSANSVLVPTALLWQDDNDFQVVRPEVGNETLLTGNGAYNNLLPNIDFDLSFTDGLKGRVSYSRTIARAGYGQLAAGANPGTPGGSTLNDFRPPGGMNNPALEPLQSDNIDLSIEYYFSDRGYVSAAFFGKKVKNFIGTTVTERNLFGIRDQTGGPRADYAMEYLSSRGFNQDDSSLFTLMAMIDNPDGFTDRNNVFWAGGEENYRNGDAAQHVAFATQYDILPRAEDPLYTFAVQSPVNNEAAKIHGFEVGGQYFFGESGFGLLANYTIVRGDIGYDNTSNPNDNHFALVGLSDSANAVLMFEKFGLSARLAWNWRDEFLQNLNVGQWRNPVYVEEYQQFDLSVGYTFNDNLSLSVEGINLTGEDVRWHGRSAKQVWRMEDQGPRFALGARYKF
jgi:TonB-dependent receptor